ncbi:hypothetical protein K469DRAFT_379836 [Zopfia rhizophila CBS 207.26]|uniref:Uncharacterized protein n=1 Tax=Zopfia rhizophila CBS 207.26 TaxID=1314779 RepID=A0A6A6DDP0_9PEZI|nr:hypothetical protein K469DRAFT_379836 [Zopfia rhizophila CBS 207.26]
MELTGLRAYLKATMALSLLLSYSSAIAASIYCYDVKRIKSETVLQQVLLQLTLSKLFKFRRIKYSVIRGYFSGHTSQPENARR